MKRHSFCRKEVIKFMRKSDFEIELETKLEAFLQSNHTDWPKVVLPESQKWRGLTGYASLACYLVDIEYSPDITEMIVISKENV